MQISRYGFLPSYYAFLKHQIETEHYLLGPVSLLRYLYPLMLSTPLLLGIIAAPSMPTR